LKLGFTSPVNLSFRPPEGRILPAADFPPDMDGNRHLRTSLGLKRLIRRPNIPAIRNFRMAQEILSKQPALQYVVAVRPTSI
jgi:hypothetical protein